MSRRRCLMPLPFAIGGGVIEAFLTSIEIMRRAGCDVIAVVDPTSVYLDRLRATGAEVHVLPGLAARGSLGAWWAGLRLGRLVRRLAPDVILAHNGRLIEGLKASCPRLPLVGVVHTGKLRRFLAADRLITVNAEQRDGLIEAGFSPTRIGLLPNVLPLDAIPPFAPRPFAAPLRVGTLRRLLHEKGVDILVEAVARLIARGLDVELHIGGNGEEEATLHRQVAAADIETRVHFHGWVSDQAAFLGQTDIYVMPSRHETFGIGILEAQAAGLPVIASACEGPRAVIRDEETGLLVPPADPAALAAALGRLIADPALAARLARAGHEDCAARHLLPAVVAPYSRFVLDGERP